MSFSEDIRSTSNFQRQFSRLKRRLQKSEIPKADIDSLQEHVNELRTYAHFVNLTDIKENISDIALGPHDYILEPDYSTVKLRTLFRDVHGNVLDTQSNNYSFETLNALNYYTLKLFDQAASNATIRFAIPQSVVGTLDQIFDFETLWQWRIGFHPPNLKHGNSISLNVDTHSNEFLYVSNMGTKFDFTGNNFSIGFWIYPTDVSNSGSPRVVALRWIDSNNNWEIMIDTDSKLFAIVKVAGVSTKREYATPLTANNWYFVALTWDTTPVVTLKVNDNADTSSTKSSSLTSTDSLFYFGSYPGSVAAQDFKGYLTGLTFYKPTLLNSTQLTSLYNYNTISVTTKPGIWGIMQYGTPAVVGGSFTTISFTTISFTT